MPPVASDALADILRRHDIFITASRHESCSNALTEALSCGLPAVAIDSGANREIVGDGGFMFEHREELPALLERLVAEYDVRQRRIQVPSIADVGDAYLKVMGLPATPEAA
jgi:glycosyltransferase involved in cell wall biosynthesis